MQNFLLRYKYTYLGQLKIYNTINRSSFCLSDDERLALTFVLDRTIGWQKVCEKITLKEFESGIYRRIAGQRRLVTAGTGLTPDRATRAINALVEMGAIQVDNLASGTIYRIIENWCHPALRQNRFHEMWKLNEDDYIYQDDQDSE